MTVTSGLTTPVSIALSGTLSGSLSIESDTEMEIILNGVTITSTAGPALSVDSSIRSFIISPAGKTNTLTDTAPGDGEDDWKSTLYTKGPMIIGGTGSLIVNAHCKHGIYSKDYIRFTDGTVVTVNVDARDAVRCMNGIIIDDVDLTIDATGTAEDDESKGMKVDGDESEDGAGRGYVVINGGTIDITSVSKGITANWDIDEDAETEDTSDDPDPYVIINSGYITITTIGTPYETTNSEGDEISLSPEGIEGKSRLTVNDGYIVINSTDDCLNAGDDITINGGYIYCKSTDNDSIDSNGTMTITGGVVIAMGSASPEGGFDCDNNTFAITGGTLIGTGGSTSTPTTSACTQNVFVLYQLNESTNTTIGIQDSKGNTVFIADIPSIADAIIISSPEIVSNTAYSFYAGGTATAETEFYGLGLGELTLDGGEEATTLTTSTTVTTYGSAPGPNGR